LAGACACDEMGAGVGVDAAEPLALAPGVAVEVAGAALTGVWAAGFWPSESEGEAVTAGEGAGEKAGGTAF